MIRFLSALATLTITAAALPAPAQLIPRATAPVTPSAPPPPYAAVADLVVAAPLIADVTVRRATRLRPTEAPDTPADFTRFLVEAQVNALILGPASLPQRISFVAQLANDAGGRPRFPRDRELLFARAVPGQADAVQLIRPAARLPWSPVTDALVRRIAREAAATGAPPAITGVGTAVHSPGALPGEGRTQIFLVAADGRPVSLVIDRAQDSPPRWSVALGELIDQGAPPPAPATLLWYRLACGLPPTLPDASLAEADADAARQVREDYRVVLGSLGRCDRGDATLSGGGGPG